MNNCKDCISFDACCAFWYSDYDSTQSIEETKKKRGQQPACERFKDKSRFIELPCAVGDPVFKICPQSKSIPFGSRWNGKEVTHPCHRCPWESCDCSHVGYIGNEFEYTIRECVAPSSAWIVKRMDYFGTVYFTDYPSAAEYLKKKEEEYKFKNSVI